MNHNCLLYIFLVKITLSLSFRFGHKIQMPAFSLYLWERQIRKRYAAKVLPIILLPGCNFFLPFIQLFIPVGVGEFVIKVKHREKGRTIWPFFLQHSLRAFAFIREGRASNVVENWFHPHRGVDSLKAAKLCATQAHKQNLEPWGGGGGYEQSR